MAWSTISTYATSIPDTVPLFTPTWRNQILSQWYWALLPIVIVSIMALLHRRYCRDLPDETPWQDFIPPVQDAKDSPFFAYLGHNVLTEGCPHNPSNTSMDAIGRISYHNRLEHVMTAEVAEEPQKYNSDINDVLPSLYQYRNYTYPDSQNKQIRYDRVEQMQDSDQDRSWQRRTMYICAI